MTPPRSVSKQPSRCANYRPHPLRRAAVLAAKIALAAAALILNVIALPPARAADKHVIVKVANFTYSPNVITVSPDTTVTWINHDDIPHTVTATAKAFRSRALDTDDTFTFTFTKPGDYAYFCSLHPQMTGEVVVRPAAGQANRSRNQGMLAHNGL